MWVNSLGPSEKEEGTISQMRGPKANGLRDLDGAVKGKSVIKQKSGGDTIVCLFPSSSHRNHL